MAMKIENYEGTADTFTFPHNPTAYDASVSKFVDKKEFSYNYTHYGLSNELMSPTQYNLSGHTDGSSKNDDFRSISRHFNESKLKKLYFSSDKFAIIIPGGAKRTFRGGRTNFIDYAASGESPFSILFDEHGGTPKSGGSSSSAENEGNTTTPILEITGTPTNTSEVTVSDGDGNGFKFTPTSASATTIKLITLTTLGADNVFTEYFYADIGGTRQKLKAATSGKRLWFQLSPGQTLSNLFSGGSISANFTPTFKFRDGWSGE